MMNEDSNREFLFTEDAHFRNCHASTVLPLEDGTILTAYFAGTRERDPDVGIWLSRRVDQVWESPVCIAKIAPSAHWNPVLFRIRGGVRLVFKVGDEIRSWKSWTMVSRDNGITWSGAAAYPAPNDACGPVRSKPLRLSNGLLLAPNSDETENEWLPRVDVSDDDGASFDLLARIPVNISNPAGPNYISGKGAIQPTLWESARGHVHMLLRTTGGFIFRSDSDDEGRTWRQAYNTGLPSNNSGIDIAASGGDLYLLLNPVSGNWAARTPLAVYRSIDNGRHFTAYATLESQESDIRGKRRAEFSYPAAVAANGRLYITYTCMRRQIAFRQLQLP